MLIADDIMKIQKNNIHKILCGQTDFEWGESV